MATVRVERSDAQRELQDAMRVEQDLQKQLDDAKQKVRRCQEKKESLKLREGRMRGTMERSKMSSRDDLRGHELAVQLAQQSQEGLLSAKKILEKKKKEIIKIVEKSTESWQKKASEGVSELSFMRSEFFKGEVERFMAAEKIVSACAIELDNAEKSNDGDDKEAVYYNKKK